MIVGAGVLEVANQLLLLGVDRDDRLPCSLRGDHLRVDVLELRVAVRMPGAFLGLPVVLTREAEFHQLLGNRVGADQMAHLRQRGGGFVHALRHPQQGPLGIAQRGSLDEALQLGNQPSVALAHRPAPAAGTANPPPRQRRGVPIVLAAIDRRAGEPGDPGDQSQRPPAGSANLGRCKHATTALIQAAPNRIPAIPDAVRVDHAPDLRLFAPIRNPHHPSQSEARKPQTDPIIVRNGLRP